MDVFVCIALHIPTLQQQNSESFLSSRDVPEECERFTGMGGLWVYHGR
jgi:hypothetical protein